MAQRVLARKVQGGRRDIRRADLHRLERAPSAQRHGQSDGDGPSARSHVCDAERPDPRTLLARPQATHDLRLSQFDEPFRLRPRDQRPWVHQHGQPEELLEPTDIRNRLPGRPPLDPGPKHSAGIRPDRRVRVRQDDRPTHPDGVSQQKLRIEPGRL